jgi:hypothetical protein
MPVFINVTLDIADVVMVLMEKLCFKYPNASVSSLEVVSYNTVLFKVEKDMLVSPSKHKLVFDSCELSN